MWETISELMVYKCVFMAELLISVFLMTFRFHRRKYYWLRFVFSNIACLAFAFFFPVWQYNAVYTSCMFFILFLSTIGYGLLCYDEPVINIIFSCVTAYIVQHMAYQIYQIFTIIFDLESLENLIIGTAQNWSLFEVYGNQAYSVRTGFTYISVFAIFSICYWLMFLVFGDQIKRNEQMELHNRWFLAISALVLVVVIVLYSVMVYRTYLVYDQTYVVLILLLTLICCLFALILLFMMLKNQKLKNEAELFERLLHQKEEQYLVSKENMELINLKCHDMKHQIHEIGRKDRINDESIREIEQLISIYDSAVETGNPTLDIVLTEKSLMCAKNNIRFTCVVDGKLLGFFLDSDLYSLFGNIIDNAIEAVLKNEEPEKRVINLVVKNSGGMTTVSVENYCKENIKFIDGIPQTTKADSRYHGFGVKSIIRIAEKYGGSVSIRLEDDVYHLNILFLKGENHEKKDE